jgi:hypothetical protein
MSPARQCVRGLVEPASGGRGGAFPSEFIRDDHTAGFEQRAGTVQRLVEIVDVVQRKRKDHGVERIVHVRPDVRDFRAYAEFSRLGDDFGVDVDGGHVVTALD